jgi:hypothetical protein
MECIKYTKCIREGQGVQGTKYCRSAWRHGVLAGKGHVWLSAEQHSCQCTSVPSCICMHMPFMYHSF